MDSATNIFLPPAKHFFVSTDRPRRHLIPSFPSSALKTATLATLERDSPNVGRGVTSRRKLLPGGSSKNNRRQMKYDFGTFFCDAFYVATLAGRGANCEGKTQSWAISACCCPRPTGRPKLSNRFRNLFCPLSFLWTITLEREVRACNRNKRGKKTFSAFEPLTSSSSNIICLRFFL